MPIWLQVPTPIPQASILQMTQAQVPYLVLLLVALLAFILGNLFQPVLADAGNSLRRWVKGWGRSRDFQQRYLSSVIGQHRYLPMLPANVIAARWDYRRKAVELEELYTPLSLGGERGKETDSTIPDFLRRSREPHNRLQALWWRRRPHVEPSAGDVGQAIQDQPRLVIRGDPGSGKTTLLHYLAVSCARSLRSDKRDGDDRHMVRRRLGWRQRPFPIFVPLNLLADVCAWPEERRLVDEIVNTFPVELRERCPEGFLERRLHSGNCLVMFDGFDELGSRNARGKMARLIADLADNCKDRGNRFVVSTRIVGYEGQLNGFGFSVRTVQDLDDDAIRELVTRRYRAIAVEEGLGRSEQEQKDLLLQYQKQGGRLLANLARNQGLRALTTNPLLLSLIVLIDSLRIPLPEQRHILYRDCVEILTERWQARKRNEVGLARSPQPGDLTLDQKVSLLQELALTMQKRRQGTDGVGLMERGEVAAIIAARLPSFIAAYLPREEERDARCQECVRRANALLDDIREESGILTEKGLNAAGEPVIGFSHLTFQEYLAAAALREWPHERSALLADLFSPVWREVVLLLVAMTDAGDVIRACLEDVRQALVTRYLLAGRCMAEKVTVEPAVRQRVMDRLCAYFRPPQAADIAAVDDLLNRMGGEQHYDWLIGNLADLLTDDERARLAGSLDAGAPGVLYTHMQEALLRIMQEAGDSLGRYTAGCVLSGIGDPRDLDEMVTVPAGEFTMGGEKYDDEKPVHAVQVGAFVIGKYPVTNAQYGRFVAATGHRPPDYWPEGKPLPWKATHPVVYVNWYDTVAYCEWLSRMTGRPYRLPTEAEWEKAASWDAGADGRPPRKREYPWGDEPPNDRLCNFNMNVGDTAAVGSYHDGASPYGVLDMAGNVWEWTRSLWGRDWQKSDFGYPYDPNDGREDGNAPDAVLRVLRGGSFRLLAQVVRCAYRNGDHPVDRFDVIGFRVVSPGF